MKHYYMKYQISKNETNRRTGVRSAWVAPVYHPTTTGLMEKIRGCNKVSLPVTPPSGLLSEGPH
jgi:hypothetical protein